MIMTKNKTVTSVVQAINTPIHFFLKNDLRKLVIYVSRVPWELISRSFFFNYSSLNEMFSCLSILCIPY